MLAQEHEEFGLQLALAADAAADLEARAVMAGAVHDKFDRRRARKPETQTQRQHEIEAPLVHRQREMITRCPARVSDGHPRAEIEERRDRLHLPADDQPVDGREPVVALAFVNGR